MIKAFLFDMDGTLVQTEILKAMSYAKAAHELRPSLKEQGVIDAFKDVVGLSRKEVAQKLMERFSLEKEASARMDEFNVHQPWQAFVQLRMGIYDSMISDPDILNKHLCPYNLSLLKWVRQNKYPTGLGTQSQRPETMRILENLKIKSDFDFIATREDVENPKPDPEIYNLLASELNVIPYECLVIEDSASGVKAAIAAGMGCIAVTTDLTRDGVRKLGLLEGLWIVDSPSELLGVVKRYISEINEPQSKSK
ncbi:MAG TPA: HAD family phosphatase [Thermodesulfobacteriota bacterium]|nr:HAD family phosphatase [Thermodesulfobacteriota bacterium]